MTIRWGIAGPGRMANALVGDFAHVPGAMVTAVGSRSVDRAYQFASHHGIGTAHGSYAELLADPNVDVVYIATPHPQHHDIAMAAIDAGKGVLVEKAFTATLEGTQEIVRAARDKGVFAMEAMWTRFQPAVATAKKIVDAGEIGELVAVQGDLCAYRDYQPTDRLFDPAKGGGALLDLGVYVTSFAQYFLGEPTEIMARGSHYPNGVEAAASILLGYESGATAALTCALSAPGPGQMAIVGTKGWIHVPPRFHHPNRIVVHREGMPPHTIDAQPIGTGYAHELIEVTECMAAGRTESSIMPLDDTVSVMRTLEACGRQLGVEWHEAEDVL